MLPVEIHPIQDAIVLRARGSELLILASHVTELKKLKSAGDFSRYFLNEALVNRPARKLFEAWLRKDGSLWARIYKTVQTIESGSGAAPGAGQSSGKKDTAPTNDVKDKDTSPKAAQKTAKKLDDSPKSADKSAPESRDKSASTKPPKNTKTTATKAEPKKTASTKPATKPAGKTAVNTAAKSADKSSATTTSKKPAAKAAPKKTKKK